MKKRKIGNYSIFLFFALLNEKEDNKWINEKAKKLYKIDFSEITILNNSLFSLIN
jgi:hypothetical protein